mgnify:CR=1 FL=1
MASVSAVSAQPPWQAARERISQTWSQLSPTARWAVLGAAVLLLAGVIYGLVAATSQPAYAPLFADLSPREAGEVAQVLQEQSIPYQLSNGGTTILVPEHLVYQTRIQLAAQGIPSGGKIGYELLNQNSLGMTEYERRVRYVIALQGELARTIEALGPVREARVHIVQPQPSVFVSERRPASASVLVDLRPGQDLDRQQIRAIVNLVAASVEGLTTDQVTLVDTRGRTLSDLVQENTLDAVAMSHLELQRNYEMQLQTSVQSMLEQVFGYGKAVVRVKTQMDFSSSDEVSEEFLPVQGGGIRSEQRIEERYEGSGSVIPGGVAGVESNVPGYVSTSAGPATYERLDTITNYEFSRRQIQRTVPPGRIVGLSVAVWVDGTLTPAQQAAIQEAVASAVGADRSRGDTVTVQALEFSRPVADTFPAEEAVPLPYLIAAGVLLAAVVGGLLAWSIRRRRIRQAQEEAAAAAQQQEEELPSLSTEEMDRSLRRIRELALRDPKNFVQLLRSWLTEE